MDPERWRTIERLYHAALERRDPGDRGAFLDSACVGDAALRADVESLLAHDPDASSFMEAPAVAHLVADVPAAPPRVGTRLGPYQLGALVGAGGMGEVYRASDTRLGRDVAIKVLPAFWSSDPDRRARLEREARAVAAVTHPHICALYDVGRDGDVEYLVLEYVEGETLAERLRRGALPLDDVLRIAGQMASGLAAAHARGIVHRDLKPANIVLTRSGAKLLDFGLAKLAAPARVSSVSQPTDAASLTAAGMILGTLQYMSPEQVEGHEADARSDIFAFGAVLHEMIAGAKAFEAKTQASLIAAILEREPAPLPQLRPETPASLARLVRTCLAKDPAQRWQSAVDLERELAWVREDLGPASFVAPAHRSSGRLPAIVPWSIAALAVVVAVASLVSRLHPLPPQEDATMHLSLPLPDATGNSARFPTISPDGRRVAYVETREGGNIEHWRLWIQDLDSADAHAVEGTAEAVFPFWSPDSTSLAFFAKGALRRLDLKTGAIQTLCDAPAGRGGSWSPDGTIVFSPDLFAPLVRVSAQGGAPTPVTHLDPAAQDRNHRLPFFLPDGRHFLFTKIKNTDTNVLSVGSLDSPASTDIVTKRGQATQAIFASGKLLFVSEGTLVAQEFDLTEFAPRGERMAIVSRVDDDGLSHMAFSASSSGTIVYRAAGRQSAQLAVLARNGTRLRAFGEPADYNVRSVSGDGRKVAVERLDPTTSVSSIWLLDTRGGQLTPLTSGPDSAFAVWSADNRRILYQRETGWAIYEVRALDVDSRRDDLVLPSVDKIKSPWAWLADGTVLYGAQGPSGPFEMLWRARPGSRDPGEQIPTARNPQDVVLSPDGAWMAYVSNASGVAEIYVQQFPDGPWQQITSGGGASPQWRADGRELFYLTAGGTLNAAAVNTGPRLDVGTPVILFHMPGRSSYAPAPDGKTFYVALGESETPTVVMVLVNGLRK